MSYLKAQLFKKINRFPGYAHILSGIFEILLPSEILEIWIHKWRTSNVTIKLGH